VYGEPVEARHLNLAVIVLAAGAGSRFSGEPGAKLLADIDGRPMLARVLDEVRAYRPAVTVVVLGHGAGRIETTLEWHAEIRVRNHEPGRGLSSSLQIGIDALRALPHPLDGAFIVLGDQPALRADVMRALEGAAARARPGDRPAVTPRYEASGARNPVLLLRPAWAWVDELEGDRGLGPLLEARPDQVLQVGVAGDMPDVDRPADVPEHGSS
jgi:molybdenum cofactor cytidylyltransferase